MTRLPRKPALQYPGGKWRLAPWVIEHFPSHHVYVEPFSGGAGALLRKPRSHVEVLNDINHDVVNFFRVLRNPETSRNLQRLCNLTPFARVERDGADTPSDCPVEAARRYAVRSWMGVRPHNAGFTGIWHNGRGARNRAWMWTGWCDEIPALAERLRNVVIECRDALHIIRKWDAPAALFYVDPPYPLSTRKGDRIYDHEMTDGDHEELRDLLATVEAAVVLSTYPHPIYDALGWLRSERRARSFTSEAGQNRTEALYCNEAAQDRRELALL